MKRPNQYDPPTGPFLGDLTNEYPGKKIVKFASAGPKNYTYVFSDASHVTKVKGISLNYLASRIITPSLVENVAKSMTGDDEVSVTNPRKIARCRKVGIITRPETKRYRRVFTKRVLVSNRGLSYPYGHKDIANAVVEVTPAPPAPPAPVSGRKRKAS